MKHSGSRPWYSSLNRGLQALDEIAVTPFFPPFPLYRFRINQSQIVGQLMAKSTAAADFERPEVL